MSDALELVLPMPPNETVVRRFWEKVRKTDDCWERGNLPYSRMWDGSRSILNHRFSWVLHNGPIPPGLVVCHRCDNPKCVRPAHLFLGTQQDNIRDCHAKGRAADPIKGISEVNARKTRCVGGHELTAENVIIYTRKNGRDRRICRACRREAGRRHDARRRR